MKTLSTFLLVSLCTYSLSSWGQGVHKLECLKGEDRLELAINFEAEDPYLFSHTGEVTLSSSQGNLTQFKASISVLNIVYSENTIPVFKSVEIILADKSYVTIDSRENENLYIIQSNQKGFAINGDDFRCKYLIIFPKPGLSGGN